MPGEIFVHILHMYLYFNFLHLSFSQKQGSVCFWKGVRKSSFLFEPLPTFLSFKCLDLQGPFLVSLPEIMQKAQFNNEMNKILGTPGNSGKLFGTRNSSCLGGIHIVDLWWDHPLASWQSDIFSLWIDFKQRIREWHRQHSQFLQCFHSKHWDDEVLFFLSLLSLFVEMQGRCGQRRRSLGVDEVLN